MRFYEAPPPEEEKKNISQPDAQEQPVTPKDKAAAGPVSGGFRLTVFQAAVCTFILLAAFFLRSFLPELYGEWRAKYEEALAKSILITQNDISYP